MSNLKIVSTITLLFVLSIGVNTLTRDYLEKPETSKCFLETTPPNLFLGAPGAGYAMSFAKALELMWCIKGAPNAQFSYLDIMCNCKECANLVGNPDKGGELKMASFFVKEKGIVGGGAGVNKNTTGFTKWPQPQNYKYCLDWHQSDCYPTSIFGLNKCQGGIKQFTSILDPQMCPTNCNVGGGSVEGSRSRDVFSTFIEKQGHQNMMNALINSPVPAWIQYTENIFFHKNLDIPWSPRGQTLGYIEMIIVGHSDNHNGHGPCWRIMIFGGKLGGDLQTRTMWVRATVNFKFMEDVGWEIYKQ